MRISEFTGLENYVSNQYVLAFLVLLISLFVLRGILAVFQKLALRLSSKTKTNIDDEIIGRSNHPLTWLSFLISIRLSLEELSLIFSIENTLTLLIYTGIVFNVFFIVYVVIDALFFSAVRKVSAKSKIKVDESLISLGKDMVKFSLIIISVLYILDLWGFEILPLLGALGIAGIAVALALQPTLGNIFSGISMVLDKSVKVGDWIVIDENTKGIVQKVGIRSTKIISFDNEIIIIPNTRLADSRIQNISLPEPKARVVVPFSTAYGSDIAKVKKIVVAEIKKVNFLMKDFEPLVRFTEMSNSSLNFKAYFYVDSYQNKFGAIDEANTRIYNALNKAGISIPFPQMDVHLKKD